MTLEATIGTPPEQMARVAETDFGPIDIAFDDWGNPGDPALVLIQGLGTQMIFWDEGFCEEMVTRGFRVIRVENRDCGHSTVLRESGVPGIVPVMLGIPANVRYRMSDMASDVVGVMDHLGIEKAHITGVSMGGMIAQTIAIEHPGRVLSLASIMSRTGALKDAPPHPKQMALMFKPVENGYDAYIERTREVFSAIGSPAYPIDPERLLALADRAWERGVHRDGTARQMHAVNTQPNRNRALRRVSVPTVVIHGTADKLVRPAGGRATARAIPGARLRMFEGMGHDLPLELWPHFAAEIDSNANRSLPLMA